MQGFLESFFIPSRRLTVAITLAQEEEAAEPQEEYPRRARFTYGIDEEAVSENLLEGMPENYFPKEQLHKEINASMHELIEHKQEEIAERLYHFLAFLSRNPLVEHQIYNLFETIPVGMGTMLGLSHRYGVLLQWLTRQFKRWLSKQDNERYETAWGIMRLEGNYIELVATSFHDKLPTVEEAVYKPALEGPYSEEG